MSSRTCPSSAGALRGRLPSLVAVAACSMLLVVAEPVGASAADPTGSAFGFSFAAAAGGDLLFTIEPTPVIECPGSTRSVEVDVPEPADEFLSIAALELECTNDAGVLRATATANGVTFDGLGFGPSSTEVLAAECSTDGGPHGSSDLVGLEVEGRQVEVTGAPNQRIESDLYTLILNQQVETENDDGTISLTVTALAVEVQYPGRGPAIDARFSSVTCTAGAATDPPPTDPPVIDPPITDPPITDPPPTTGSPPAVPVTEQPTFTG